MGNLCNKVDKGETIYEPKTKNKIPKKFQMLERKQGSLAHGELSREERLL